MVLVGVFYLVFEDVILSDFSSIVKAELPPNHITRALVGTQIGLIVLSMIVTRSSALSLQAKLGLPRGNQIVGWLVLGMISILWVRRAVLTYHSCLTSYATGIPCTTKQSLPPQADGRFPQLCADLCNPNHLVRRLVLCHLLRNAGCMGAVGARSPRLFVETCVFTAPQRVDLWEVVVNLPTAELARREGCPLLLCAAPISLLQRV